jgi:hypothetical protein
MHEMLLSKKNVIARQACPEQADGTPSMKKNFFLVNSPNLGGLCAFARVMFFCRGLISRKYEVTLASFLQ